jgi:hypothetical protein
MLFIVGVVIVLIAALTIPRMCVPGGVNACFDVAFPALAMGGEELRATGSSDARSGSIMC